MTDYRIDVLVPSRGRPSNVLRLMHAVSDTASAHSRVRLRVRLDDDDPENGSYGDALRAHGGVIVTSGPRIRLAASWNEQAAEASADGATHLALWGDDVIPVTQGWDLAFVERLERDGPGFAYGRDGIWDNTFNQQVPGHLVLPTACVMPVEVYRALGWVSPPGLIHLCIDLAWRDLGFATDSLFYEPGVLIRHLHRLVGAPNDQTYMDANDNSAQVTADSNAFNAWREGEGFRADMDRMHCLREAWLTERMSRGK